MERPTLKVEKMRDQRALSVVVWKRRGGLGGGRAEESKEKEGAGEAEQGLSAAGSVWVPQRLSRFITLLPDTRKESVRCITG